MKRVLAILVACLAVPAIAWSAGKANQKIILEFVDGGDLSVTLADKSVEKLGTGVYEGDEVPAGATITTGADTSAELRIKPNGTILKIAKGTSFTIKTLAGPTETKNAFALVAGKIRAVAAKGAEYQVSSRTAVCAVRGTDFAFDVTEGSKAQLMVAEGLVQFDKVDDTGAVLASIGVAKGMAADAFAPDFTPAAYNPDQYNQEFGDMGFKKLKESDVPPKALDSEPQAQTPAPAATQPAVQPTTQAVAAPAPAKAAQPAPESPFMKWLEDSLGFDIGAVTIDQKTYSKAVIQPEIDFGKAKLGLYLPVIYSNNLFDPNSWYKPQGNNEWDFGSSYFNHGDYYNGAADLARDLLLKIKYFEFGEQYKDPFFVKLGNLEDMTLGHGILMRDYANDTDFPSVRRLGFDMGADLGGGGFELVANDLYDPQIIGGRLFIRPVSGNKFAFGVQGIVDRNPAEDDTSVASTDSGLMILGTAADLDLPIIESDFLGIRLFGDMGATAPYTQSAVGSKAAGLQYQLVYDQNSGQLKNWGAETGVLGNILFIDYRLEYRYTTGYFQTSLFDSTYDRMKSQYASQYLGYISTASTQPDMMGIYGEGGFKLFSDKLDLKLGYYWPWSTAAGLNAAQQLAVSSSDEFHAKLTVKKGAIPLIGLAGAIYYDKRGLAQSISNKSFSFLDANSTFGGELDLPVPNTPNLDLAFIFLTQPVRDASGNVVYANAAQGIPELQPSISIETRFHL